MELKRFGEKAYNFIMTPISEDARITILEGAVRSSKTVCMIPKLLALVDHGPQGMGLITGVSKDTIHDNVLRDLFEIVGESSYTYNRQSGDMCLFGKDIKVVGAKDEGSEKYIRGKTIAWAYGDEISLMPENFFKQLLNRLSVPGAKFYGTTNPDSPFHYLYREYITDPDKLARGMVKVLHFDLDDNPTLTDEYKHFIRYAYSGVFYQRAILGKWVVAEGAIYRDCWSDDLLFDDESAPVNLYQGGYIERWIANDYGTDHPHVYLDMLDDGDTIWVVREYYWDSHKEYRQKTDSEYADDLQAFLEPELGLPIADDAQIILPPEAASFEAELLTRGIVTTNADNEVLDGIRVVSSMMKLKKLRVHRRCENLRREIATYCWDTKAGMRGEEKPIKKNDDAVDCLRYGVKTKTPFWRLAA